MIRRDSSVRPAISKARAHPPCTACSTSTLLARRAAPWPPTAARHHLAVHGHGHAAALARARRPRAPRARRWRRSAARGGSPFRTTAVTPAPARSGRGRRAPARHPAASPASSAGDGRAPSAARAARRCGGGRRPRAGPRRRRGRSAARCPGCPGRRPALAPRELELRDLGHDLPRGLQQRVHAAGGERRVEALLLHRRAQHQRGRRRGRAGSSAGCARSARPARACRRARAARGSGPSRAAPAARAPAGRAPGSTRPRPRPPGRRARSAPSRRRTPVTRLRSRSTAATSAPSASSPPARLSAARQRLDHGPRVGLRVLRGEHAAGDARRQPRLEPPALARRQPLRVQAQRALEGVQPAQLLGVVAIGGHHQRAASRGSRWAAPLRSSSSAAKPGHSSREARLERAAGPPRRSRPR